MNLDHVAIIMDGNGRWAKKKGLPISKGHTEGVNRIEDVCNACAKNDIKNLTIYAFSTENWKRSNEEISHLFKLIKIFYKKKLKKLQKEGVSIRFLGFNDNVPQDILELFSKITEETKNNSNLYLNIAFNYGSQDEIVNAVNEFINKKPGENISKKDLEDNLFTRDMPNVDLLIRTSGEQRLSNFLLWQVAYSEFVFTDVLWPDFKEKEFEDCLDMFYKRERRYGGR